MKTLIAMRYVFSIVLFIICNGLVGQKLTPKERIIEPDHILFSKIMGKEYQLYISFPKGYTTRDTISYPVLYVLDGRNNYQAFNAAQTYLSVSRSIQEVIIVGISSGLDFQSWLVNRTYDYTPSVDTIAQREMETQFDLPKGSIKTGGAGKFLECIKTEIDPFVSDHYKTNSHRGISGHSFGGLFSAYCLLNSDGYFTRFALNSPSLEWNNNEILNESILKFSSPEPWNIPPTRVFISVGELETPNMVSSITQFHSYLAKRDYAKINLSWQIFEKETHLSVIPANLSRTLSVLYGKE